MLRDEEAPPLCQANPNPNPNPTPNPNPHPSQVLAAVASGDPVSARSLSVAECAARIIAANTGAGASAG